MMNFCSRHRRTSQDQNKIKSKIQTPKREMSITSLPEMSRTKKGEIIICTNPSGDEPSSTDDGDSHCSGYETGLASAQTRTIQHQGQGHPANSLGLRQWAAGEPQHLVSCSRCDFPVGFWIERVAYCTLHESDTRRSTCEVAPWFR